MNERERRTGHGRPSVAGVAGGVGTTTVAAALGGTDRGIFTGRAVDVLVCRATAESLIRAARAAQLITGAGGTHPVLAVSPADPRGPSRPSTARMRLLEPHTAAVVVLPWVRRWRDMAVPLDDLAALARAPTEMPRALRRYAAAVNDLRTALGTPSRNRISPSRHLAAARPEPPISRSTR